MIKVILNRISRIVGYVFVELLIIIAGFNFVQSYKSSNLTIEWYVIFPLIIAVILKFLIDETESNEKIIKLLPLLGR